MNKLRDLGRSKTYTLIALTLLLGAIFKVSAFARETFIASRFGLSSTTDAYFSLQQLPLAVASFMFGPFCRAFTPAYADARVQNRKVDWLPGLIFYATTFGLLLTALSLALAPITLHLFTRTAHVDGWHTLAILSICYWPIVQIGLFAGIATSYGRNLSSLTMTGLPFLLMTVALGAIYLMGSLGSLSLPISMTIGFAAVGVLSLAGVVFWEKPFSEARYLFNPWKSVAFRSFTRQLGVSAAENLGYSANQMMILFFMARAGTGAISANNCAGRIGMLGFSLLVQPLSQLMQARLCVTDGSGQKKVYRLYLLAMTVGTILLAVLVCSFRYPVASTIYRHGKFTGEALDAVASLLPAWLSYFVVMSLNVVNGQYLFRTSKGSTFTRNMLCGYGLANVIRFATMNHLTAPWIIWCSVIGDGSALVANLAAGGKALSARKPPPTAPIEDSPRADEEKVLVSEESEEVIATL